MNSAQHRREPHEESYTSKDRPNRIAIQRCPHEDGRAFPFLRKSKVAKEGELAALAAFDRREPGN
jgi:hypothetical protein